MESPNEIIFLAEIIEALRYAIESTEEQQTIGKMPTKKVCNQPDSKVTYYNQKAVILVDAVRPGFGERNGASRDDLRHEQKNNMMKDLYTRYVVRDQLHEIIMNPGDREAVFFRRLKELIDQYDQHDHITIIYHGGRTGMFENDYKW